MNKERPNLLDRVNDFCAKVQVAKNTVNPFKAKALKEELEPQIQPLIVETVSIIEALQNQVNDLQHQINNMTGYSSELGD